MAGTPSTRESSCTKTALARPPGQACCITTNSQRGHALQVLELSGGGQNGSFGAGFLKGWAESGSRPTCDIVTGVSSGALLATHAFLGTPADDAKLVEVFTELKAGDIYKKLGLFKVLFGSQALMNTDPFAKFLERCITDEDIDRVGQACDKGRRLYVATTNLDYGQTWVWNMTLLAKQGDQASRRRYRHVLLAAASPPIAFPPQEIAGHLLADGATRANLLVVGLTGEQKPEPPLYGPGNVYVIHNGRATRPPKAVKREIVAIAGAGLAAAMDSSMEFVTARADFATHQHGYEFHMVSIPSHVDIGNNMLAFDPVEMRAGFDAGHELGKSQQRWDQSPSEAGYPAWLGEGPGDD